MDDMSRNFLWKYIDIPENLLQDIRKLYLENLPYNTHFFQPLSFDINSFLGLEVKRFVLIQVEPFAVGRIHTDYRPSTFGDTLAINIALENCEDSVTEMWKSSYSPPIQYTSNGQPYRYFDRDRCTKVSEFVLDKPVLFRTDVPHSVNNRNEKIRKAISIRFKEDPWHLIQ